jgi:hypothetical protein
MKCMVRRLNGATAHGCAEPQRRARPQLEGALRPRRRPRLRAGPLSSFICVSGALPEKARLGAAGAIKINLRETRPRPAHRGAWGARHYWTS